MQSLHHIVQYLSGNRYRVGSYKLLGVIISDDLKWNANVEYVIAKTAKRLYALRLLKSAVVMLNDIT